MNIIEAYIKNFGQFIILIIGLPTSNKSEIAKELVIDIKPSFTIININDYMKGFVEKEVNGIKYKLYDYPDNINYDKLVKDVEDKKSTGVILYGNYIDYDKIKDIITIDFSYFFDLKHNPLKKNLIEKKMLPFEVLNNKSFINDKRDSKTVSKTETVSNSDTPVSDTLTNSETNTNIKSEEINNKLEIYIKDILLPVYKDIKENIKFNKFYKSNKSTLERRVYVYYAPWFMAFS